MDKTAYAALALAAALVVLHGCIAAGSGNNTNWTGGPGTGNGPADGSNPPPADNNTPPGQPLTKETCEAARGHWNECGSACRGAPPGTACIAVCVQYCECGGIAGFGCPQGYECADYLPKDGEGKPVPDAMGICRKR